MKYREVISARFLSRPNRFIAHVVLNGQEEIVHVKNTGRCKELLIPGAKVYLTDCGDQKRKTRYDLIAVEKEREGCEPLLINMDSQAPNAAAFEWLLKGNLFSENAVIRREVFYLDSRFDLFVEDGDRRAFLEVKGVTLERDGFALFPDAPTLRGVKHVEEMMRARNDGYEAYLLFVIQMEEIISFSPNDETHPQFGKALREARNAGVNLLAVNCKVTKETLEIDRFVPIVL